MKRIVCLFLALVMLLALAACGSSEPKAENEADRPAAQDTEHEAPKDAPSAENTEAPIEKEPVPERRSVDPDSIPEALTNFLARFGWYGGFGGSESFQSSKEDALRLTRSGFELILFFDGYPGAKSEYLSGEDPLGRWPFCSAYEADKADRILQTVYHLSDDAIQAIRDAGENEDAYVYYHDGKYYVRSLGVGGGYVCYPLYAETDGTDLYLYYAAYAGDVEYSPAGLQYAVVSEEELDGETVWTLKYWSRDLPLIGLPDLFGAVKQLVGDWVLEEDGLSSMRIEETFEGGFCFYVGFFRLVGFDAEAKLIKGHDIALFSSTDGAPFQGRIDMEKDALTLTILDAPNEYGADAFGGYFDGRSFRFVRGSAESVPQKEGAVDPSAWIGVWTADNGEFVQILSADDNGVKLVYRHYTEQGMIDTELSLPFRNDEKTLVSEDDSVELSCGWRYSFQLDGDCLIVSSRYPDRFFYRQGPAQP